MLLQLAASGQLQDPDQAILRYLIQIEVLEKTAQGDYQFQVPFVRSFVETLIV
jgi:hypothetical protein